MAYADTDHLFSQPIRTYKANDPYYYEVDNIPIRQLEENILWTKDQIDSLLTPSPAGEVPKDGSPLFVGDDIDLEHVKQFRPKFVGGRNIVVQAGRFNARVNDAYNVTDSLSQITADYLGGCSDLPRIEQSDTKAFFDAIWNSYTTKLSSESFISCPGESDEAAAYRANGLETMFTFYISKNFGDLIDTAIVTPYGAPEYREDGSGRGKTWPALWHSDIYNISTLSRTNWSKLNELHLKVVQHWRGVARTSVVDFRGDTLEIPPFDRYDYFYVEQAPGGSESVVSLDNLATQRIDLLVVYTHPIDSSSTTLSEYKGVSPTAEAQTPIGTPKAITTPRLGLIRGAGIGIKRTADDRIELLDKRMYSGEQKILANLNDHTDGGSNTGIKLRNGSVVHGSFPSPDDLANIAPNLSLSLGDTDLQLIGQTALPIAYVVVTKDSNTLAQSDIIDIRPFLRTTELAYNERAGVAAAEPPLSFANPAVGAAQLDGVAKCLQSQIDGIATTPAGAPAQQAQAVTKVYQDYIMGGIAYGPEGTLLSMNKSSNGPMSLDLNGVTPGNIGNYFQHTTATNKKQYIRGLYEGQVALGGDLTLSEWMADVQTGDGTRGSYLGLPSSRAIPLLPEWQPQINSETTANDANRWYSGGVTEYDFVCKSNMFTNLFLGDGYVSLYAGNGEGLASLFGGHSPHSNRNILEMFFLRKSLRVILPPNATNFSVTAEYVNSIPFVEAETWTTHGWSSTGHGSRQVAGGESAAISVSKSGVFADESGNNVVDVLVLVTYPIQNPVGLGRGARIPYRVFQHFFGGQTGGNGELGTSIKNAQTVISMGAGSPPHHSISRLENAEPFPKMGFAYYPTISLTLSFHELENVQPQMVPQETLDNQLVTGAEGGNQWTQNPVYPLVYEHKIIDLTS
jgi:hypothetical protein